MQWNVNVKKFSKMMKNTKTNNQIKRQKKKYQIISGFTESLLAILIVDPHVTGPFSSLAPSTSAMTRKQTTKANIPETAMILN